MMVYLRRLTRNTMLHCRSIGLLTIIGLLALTWNAGCSRPAASVSGKVTLDGAPLDDANISFVPQADTQKQAGWATISGGQYSIPESNGLGTGEFHVEIRALRPTGEKSNDPTMIPAREIIPAKYNTQTQLTAEIKAGDNVKDFELKSK